MGACLRYACWRLRIILEGGHRWIWYDSIPVSMSQRRHAGSSLEALHPDLLSFYGFLANIFSKKMLSQRSSNQYFLRFVFSWDFVTSTRQGAVRGNLLALGPSFAFPSNKLCVYRDRTRFHFVKDLTRRFPRSSRSWWHRRCLEKSEYIHTRTRITKCRFFSRHFPDCRGYRAIANIHKSCQRRVQRTPSLCMWVPWIMDVVIYSAFFNNSSSIISIYWETHNALWITSSLAHTRAVVDCSPRVNLDLDAHYHAHNHTTVVRIN